LWPHIWASTELGLTTCDPSHSAYSPRPAFCILAGKERAAIVIHLSNAPELRVFFVSELMDVGARLSWLRELASCPVRKEKLISVYLSTV
jgi:hypothetical protein